LGRSTPPGGFSVPEPKSCHRRAVNGKKWVTPQSGVTRELMPPQELWPEKPKLEEYKTRKHAWEKPKRGAI